MGVQDSQCTELDQFLSSLIRNNKRVELKRKWVNPNPELKKYTLNLFSDACGNHHVFDRHTEDHPKTVVTIRSIEGTEYEHIQDDSCLSIYVGGPGSMVGAAIDSALSCQDVSIPKTQHNVMFLTYDFKHSNARSSAYYFHIRHSNALSADRSLRGPHILMGFLRRQLASSQKLELEARNLAYLKVDMSMNGIMSSPSHCLNTMIIVVKELCHTYHNAAIHAINPRHTDWAHNRTYSLNSAPVLRFLEATGEKLGLTSSTPDTKFKLLVGTEDDSDTPKAIHVVFDEKGAVHTEEENSTVYMTNKIKSRQLSSTEVASLMGSEKHGIHKAYVYPGDGRIMADMNLSLQKIVEKTSNTWREGVAIESVYIDKKGIRGVIFKDVQSKHKWYQPCSSLVLSLGYSAKYEFEPPKTSSQSIPAYSRTFLSVIQHKLGLSKPVPSITIATGCSGYFLVKGRIPIIGAQNSHWTEVAYSAEEDVTLAKLTGGGNIGSEYIPAAYVLNNLEHLKKLFEDRLIDVLSIDSCPRAINPGNDVQFYKLVPGLVVSMGLGGTGMTKSGANGALSYLLTHPSVSPSKLVPSKEDLFATVDTRRLVNDYTSRTLRALNLTTSFSLLEVVSVGTGGLLGYYFLRKLSKFIIREPKGGLNKGNQMLTPHSQPVRKYIKSPSTRIHYRTIPYYRRSRICCNLRLLSFFQKLCRIRL